MFNAIRIYRNAFRIWLRIKRPTSVLDPDGPPIFIHIPKAAGSSVTRLNVQNEFGHKSWVYYRDRLNGSLPTTFAIVRHPVSRLKSAYYYLKYERGNALDVVWARRKLRSHVSLNHFVMNGLQEAAHWMHFRPQVDFVTDETGAIRVDHVLHFENLLTEWPEFAQAHNLPTDLPHENSTQILDEETLTGESLKRIAQVYSEDFRLFGYQ